MRTRTFNIALPTDLVKKVDRAAKKEYRNRSALIREALRAYLRDMEEWQDIFQTGQRVAEKLGIKSEQAVERIVSEFRHASKSSS